MKSFEFLVRSFEFGLQSSEFKPKTRNPKPQTRNQKLETSNFCFDTRGLVILTILRILSRDEFTGACVFCEKCQRVL